LNLKKMCIIRQDAIKPNNWLLGFFEVNTILAVAKIDALRLLERSGVSANTTA